jgi:hypothetical protein
VPALLVKLESSRRRGSAGSYWSSFPPAAAKRWA